MLGVHAGVVKRRVFTFVMTPHGAPKGSDCATVHHVLPVPLILNDEDSNHSHDITSYALPYFFLVFERDVTVWDDHQSLFQYELQSNFSSHRVVDAM